MPIQVRVPNIRGQMSLTHAIWPFFILISAILGRKSSSNISSGGFGPEQIRLSLCDAPNCMVITWSTLGPSTANTVEYGENEKSLTTIRSNTRTFIDKKRTYYVHSVQLSDLKSDTTYKYRCSSSGRKSKIYTLRTFPDRTDWKPTIGLFGDLGLENGRAIPQLISDVVNKQLDAIFHIGDIAYDLQSKNGTVGDQFLRTMELATASVPYMVCVGNHEAYQNFTHYRERFRMPGPSDGLYYSVNIGSIHFVVYSTEIYYSIWYSEHTIRQQYEWLEEDLKKAEKNRCDQPWIIAIAHRPMYCTGSTGDCNRSVARIRSGLGLHHLYSMENLLYRYNVDMGVWAHEHIYERFMPMYRNRMTTVDYNVRLAYRNPRAPVHVVVGLAGNPRGKDPVKRNMPRYSAFRSSTYGYGQLKIFNKTHLFFKYQSIKDQWDFRGHSDVVDSFWIIKNSHNWTVDNKMNDRNISRDVNKDSTDAD